MRVGYLHKSPALLRLNYLRFLAKKEEGIWKRRNLGRKRKKWREGKKLEKKTKRKASERKIRFTYRESGKVEKKPGFVSWISRSNMQNTKRHGKGVKIAIH